ncbi:c-type cytochrome [Ferribacterium limneticum]|uniref:c-type cytochrome n=1 Tax=Ferribacterium limneticum TaxID=76259 RepID=UPI001CFB7185|nr:c-type cytochrome [Ferribacterium limneticum]UCV29159.1 cytochrome c4 [Ferribacterium limneticum]UCV33078.1 cytochrome c4 [Ferribacterium limneticum]
MIRTAAMAILLATSFITHASEEAKSKADPAKGKVIAETVCVACHGADGNSAASANPHLAGQGEEYLYKQLKNFKAVDGKPAVRNNAIMGGMAAPLSDEDMKNVAAWFASQKLKPAAAKDEKQIALGQKLWRQGDFKKGVPACAGCHGPAGAGLPAQYPRLAGQFPEYTEAQLKSFRVDERANDPEKMMRMIAAKLSDVEIKAVAEYAAGLR